MSASTHTQETGRLASTVSLGDTGEAQLAFAHPGGGRRPLTTAPARALSPLSSPSSARVSRAVSPSSTATRLRSLQWKLWIGFMPRDAEPTADLLAHPPTRRSFESYRPLRGAHSAQAQKTLARAEISHRDLSRPRRKLARASSLRSVSEELR